MRWGTENPELPLTFHCGTQGPVWVVQTGTWLSAQSALMCAEPWALVKGLVLRT